MNSFDGTKQRRRYLSSRDVCDCRKASRPWRGVPGYGPLLCPPSRSALIFSARCLAASRGRRRGFVTPPLSTGFEGGGVWRRSLAGSAEERGAAATAAAAAAFYRAPRFLTSSHSRAHSRAALAQTPRGGFGNPSSDPSVCAQSRTEAHQRQRLPAESSGFLLVCSSRN